MTVECRPARVRTLVFAAALSMSMLAGGCADTSDPAPTDSENVDSTGGEVTVPLTAVTTAVVDPGAEPRAVVAPAVDRSITRETALHTDFRVDQQVDDLPGQDFSAPPLTIPMRAGSDGQGIGMRLGRVTSTDAQFDKDLASSEGSGAGLTVDASGAVTALRIRPATAAADNARSAIEQALYQAAYQTVSFPAEPIGVGASWTVRRQITGGVTLDQVTTARLTERDGNRLTIDLDVAQTPKEPVWNLPNGAGMLDIENFTSSGRGRMVLDLSQPLPLEGFVRITGSQDLRDPKTSTGLRQKTDNLVQWGR